MVHRANVLQRYINFNMKQDIRISLIDFNWEDHAFAVIHRYDAKIAKSLTQKSEYAYEMTTRTFGNE